MHTRRVEFFYKKEPS